MKTKIELADYNHPLFKGLAYKILTKELSHGWVEVLVENKWRNIDSNINDHTYYLAAKKELNDRNWDTGFSVACSKAESSSDFNIYEEKYVQMDAVIEDHGIYEDPADYLYSERYDYKVNALKFFMLEHVILPKVNNRIGQLRLSCSTGLCAKN